MRTNEKENAAGKAAFVTGVGEIGSCILLTGGLKRSYAIVFSVLFLMGCQKQATEKSGDSQAIFPRGELGPAQNFTGKAWALGLVKNDTTYNTLIGNVYFEPGARSNWHIHPAGQILIITAGVGYHQLKGQPRQTIRKGDVVQCPPNVMHWHGASSDSGLHQMYVISNTEKGIVKWLHPVTDEEYSAVY